jgi:DNA-directed RNA polymerase subunit RPC12/RpoP
MSNTMERPCRECGREIGLKHVFTPHKKVEVREGKKITYIYECTKCGNTVEIPIFNNRKG